jgi:TRAP-type C4-dicarboxylate transport system permease small subunit
MPAPSFIRRIDRALEQTLYTLSALLIIALSAVIIYAVFMRYVFNASPGWSEEVPRVIFLWVSYLAIAVAVSRGHTLRVMVIIERLSPRVRLALELFMHAAVFVMLGYLFWHNLPVLELTAQTKMLATGWPDSVRHWPLSVGCVLMALYQVRQVLQTIEGYQRGFAPGH